jgi:hypothetical protein
MIERLPIDIIVEIGILAGPDEYEELAKTSKMNAIILQKPYIIRAINEILVKNVLRIREEFYYQGEFHSFNDQPARTWSEGTKSWYHHGQRHRHNDLPAIVYSTGSKHWYQHGKLHRNNDLPAIIAEDGSQYWYQRGKLHRDNEQPAVVYTDGTAEWHRYGQFIIVPPIVDDIRCKYQRLPN